MKDFFLSVCDSNNNSQNASLYDYLTHDSKQVSTKFSEILKALRHS